MAPSFSTPGFLPALTTINAPAAGSPSIEQRLGEVAGEPEILQNQSSALVAGWRPLDIGHRATRKSGKRMQRELVVSSLPQAVKERIADLDQGKPQEQKHRMGSEQTNKALMQSCWISIYLPFESFRATRNAPTKSSDCPMCIQRRAAG
jgi:hypothetical protein